MRLALASTSNTPSSRSIEAAAFEHLGNEHVQLNTLLSTGIEVPLKE